ncbi:hypothetical protein ACH5RR_009489 [Cinchona calisaya]|uniref:FAR1 domain-containing protein n=1 Tax=Cinchona calisaya TaxID=153742 RepID=A0ABD3AH62_9GENT
MGFWGNVGALSDYRDDFLHESGELNEDVDVEPFVGMEFDSEEAARTFYDLYARWVGFSTRAGQYGRPKSNGIVTAWEYLCANGSKRRTDDGCEAMLRLEVKGHGKWVVIKFVKEHSYSNTGSSKVHSLRPRRHFAASLKQNAESFPGLGTVPSGIMYV